MLPYLNDTFRWIGGFLNTIYSSKSSQHVGNVQIVFVRKVNPRIKEIIADVVDHMATRSHLVSETQTFSPNGAIF